MRILILDDWPDIRKLLTDILSGPDTEIHEAENCQQAHALLAEHTFDWAILDNTLPDGHGLNVLWYIKDAYAQTKVIMLTADTHITDEALEIGALRVFIKGLDVNQIKNFIKDDNHE